MRAPLGARLRYRFDNAMARGPFVVIGYLAGLSVAIVAVAAGIAAVASFSFGGSASKTFPEDVWQSLLRMLDSGTFAGDTAWPTRVLALAVTLTGIFLAGSLIGLIASAVDQKIEQLRRGTSTVIESGHTLILGWSPQVARIISELVIANESEKRASVVVLSTEEKTAVEESLKASLGDLKTTRLVCRTGNPANPDDLVRAAVGTARSIVVVRGEDGDAGVVKTVLAIRALDPRHERAHVVAELAEPDNTRIIRSVSEGRVLTVSSDHVVAEVTAQACLQSGMAAVFTELLDFDGDEMYFAPVGALAGHPYRDALLAFEKCAVMGVKTEAGVLLNPPPDTVLQDGEDLVLVAEDDSAIAFTGVRQVEAAVPAQAERATPKPLSIAMVGWSAFGAMVLRELDEFLPPQSQVTIVLDKDLASPDDARAVDMEHATVTVQVGDGGPDDVRNLADLRPDQVIVLGYRDSLSVGDADARTLLTLLTLRTIWPAGQSDEVRIVAELLDQQNLALADPVGVDDLIVSSALSSLLMAQLSEHADLDAVFEDLFDAEGAILEMRPAPELAPAAPVSFAALVASGSAQGYSVIGYRIDATGEVKVNPAKSDVVTLGPADSVVLLSTNAA